MYLLTPRGSFSGKRPGMLALHGHGKFGYESVAGVATTEEGRQEIAEFHYDYGVQLVRRGYVVAVPCFTPFGRRVGDEKPYKKQDACGLTFIRMQALGKLLMAENLRDALWSLALLSRESSRGYRAPGLRRIVVRRAHDDAHHRSGAADPRGYRFWRAEPDPGAHHGLLRLRSADHSRPAAIWRCAEIASLIAPRPCLWEVGRQDSLMVKDRLEPALERMRRAWKAFDASGNLRVDSFEGKHRWNGVGGLSAIGERPETLNLNRR